MTSTMETTQTDNENVRSEEHSLRKSQSYEGDHPHTNGKSQVLRNGEAIKKETTPKNRQQMELEELLAQRKDDIEDELQSILQTKRELQAQMDQAEGKTESNSASKLPQEIEEGNIEYKVRTIFYQLFV